MQWIRAAATIAACSIAVQPCLAADIPGEGAVVRGRTGAFAGVGVSLPLGTSDRVAPRARLQLGPSFGMYDAQTGALLGSKRPAGLELGASRDGLPALTLAGVGGAQMKRRLGFHGSTGYIVVGGVLVLVVLLGAAVASASPKPGPRPGDFPN